MLEMPWRNNKCSRDHLIVKLVHLEGIKQTPICVESGQKSVFENFCKQNQGKKCITCRYLHLVCKQWHADDIRLEKFVLYKLVER